MPSRVRYLAILGAVLLSATSVQAERFELVYPRVVESAKDPRDDYPLGLLRLALVKAGADYDVRPSGVAMEQSRSVAELQRGGEINIGWFGTSAELERRLRPIRIPLYRGLLGHRLFIIHRDAQARFDGVASVPDLSRLTAAQGLGWADVDILRSGGLKVEEAKYDNIFALVQARRVDYFPRGVIEVFEEMETRRTEQPDLSVESGIVLIYPFDMFFFTRPGDRELARTIETGLMIAHGDGSLRAYFDSHPFIRRVMDEANLDQRRRILLPNPWLTPETRAIPDDYWLIPVSR